jgi:DNA polymerase V
MLPILHQPGQARSWKDYPQAVFLARPLPLPVDAVKVSAGFPSPAADYEDNRLDINDYLIVNPVSTFFFPVQGDSMQGAEIFDGDVLVVDRSIKPRHGHIVIAFVDGERLVKRLHYRTGRVALVAENPTYPPIELEEGMELVIWGVVTGKFKRLLP